MVSDSAFAMFNSLIASNPMVIFCETECVVVSEVVIDCVNLIVAGKSSIPSQLSTIFWRQYVFVSGAIILQENQDSFSEVISPRKNLCKPSISHSMFLEWWNRTKSLSSI